MNTTSSTPSSAPPEGKTTNPFRRNENGKRPRPDTSEVHASISALMGAAPSARETSISTGGTNAYGYVVKNPTFTKHKSGAGFFHKCDLTVILGMVDLTKGVLVDEATSEARFSIPDPYEWEQALKKKKETQSKNFIKVDKRVEHRLPLFQRVRISIPNASDLPGVHIGSVVSIEGLTCNTFRASQGPREFIFSYNAKQVVPLPAVGSDPSKILRFLEGSGAFSDWYHEEPFITEEKIKATKAFGGRHITLLPLVRKDDDPEVVREAVFDKVTPERGCIALVRPIKNDPRNYFYLPGYKKKEFEKAHETDPSVVVPDAKDAGLNLYEPFLPKASWNVVISQWDRRVHPDMGMDPQHALCYEMTVEARSRALWPFGLSHPRHWAVMAFHIPYVRGAVAFQEDRQRTCAVQGNVPRAHRMQQAAEDDITSLEAMGVGMKQFPRVWFRGGAFDVRGYLERSALHCSFETAVVLMGNEVADIENPRRAMALPGLVAEEAVLDGDGNRTQASVRLAFEPDGFVCLNATQRYKTMRALRPRVRDYYVLTPIVPKFEMSAEPPAPGRDPEMTSMANARRRDALVGRIGDAEVLDICLRATRSAMDFALVRDEFLAARDDDPACASKRAAGEWLSHSYLSDAVDRTADEGYGGEDPSCLVFGVTKGPADENPRMREQEEQALRMAIEGWRQGPSRTIRGGRAKTRVNAPDTEADRLVKGEAPNPAVAPENAPTTEAAAEGAPPAAKRPRTEEPEKAGGAAVHQECWQEIPSPPPPLEEASQADIPPPVPPRDGDDGDVAMSDGDDAGDGEGSSGDSDEV